MLFLPTTRPTDHEQFSGFRKALTAEMAITLLGLGMILLVLFWPSDLLLYRWGSPLLLGFAKMRLGMLAIIASTYVCITLSSTLKQYSAVTLGLAITAAALWLGTSLGAATALTQPADFRWVYSIYLMPFVSLVLVVPPGQRVVLTFGYTAAVLLMLSASDPLLMSVHFSGSPSVFLLFAALMSCGVGHVLYRLVQGVHRKQWELLQRETYLSHVNSRLEEELTRDAESLLSSIRQYDAVPKALEKDRKRVARDIHDELGQLLSALRIRIALAQQHVDSPQTMTTTFGELDEHLDLALNAVRGIVSDLRSPSEPAKPLAERLGQLVQRFEELTDSQCTLKLDLKGLELNQEQREHLTRIIQESLTNILRHAQATQVEIVVGVGESGLEIAIRDNGLGFEPEDAKSKGRHGLLSLQERAEILGAKLFIRSGRDAGTTIRLQLPPRNSN